MAQRVVIEIIDDLDGTEAEETVTFGLDGRDYEIDLTTENAERLRGLLSEFISVARNVKKSGRASKTARAAAPQQGDPKAIRAWAREKGIEVPERGRIPGEVRDQYLAEVG